MINIIGGTKKRTKLKVPKKNVRPTSSIKREAIFSILESIAYKKKINIYDNKCFIDIFAGSGCLGLEGISRGAKYCYFFEKDNEVLKILKENCEKITNLNNYIILKQDAIKSTFIEIKLPISVVFIDPPYEINPFKKILKKILKVNFVSSETIIVLETEHSKKIEVPSPLTIKHERKYGKTKILFLSF